MQYSRFCVCKCARCVRACVGDMRECVCGMCPRTCVCVVTERGGVHVSVCARRSFDVHVYRGWRGVTLTSFMVSPDMTFAVDWSLNNNYLSIMVSRTGCINVDGDNLSFMTKCNEQTNKKSVSDKRRRYT